MFHKRALHFTVDKESFMKECGSILALQTGVHNGTMDQLGEGKGRFKTSEDPLNSR